jgi:hypothetical protein
MVFFYISICLSAFLLFLVEPMIGKLLLPWFGGSASVWSATLLFFQLLLTGGYAYAGWLSKGNRRGWLHLALMAISLILMALLGWTWSSPITPPFLSEWITSIPPIAAIFLLLTSSTGVPFFLLASNSTWIQSWFQHLFTEQTAYRLYAFSNASSLAALAFYPTLVEPNLLLPMQGWAWSAAYLAFVTITIFLVARTLRLTPTAGIFARKPIPRPAIKDVTLWLALSACASILLLAITNYLTQQVAVIPFLWVLPLALYLLSFVLAFSGERWYPRRAFTFALLPVILLYNLALENTGKLGISLQVIIFGLVLFTGCMVCNGELYRRRPEPESLPTFYLFISIGGALGGLLVNFAAPALFKGYWELPLGVLLFCSLFLIVGRGKKGEGIKGILTWRLSLAILATSLLISTVRLFSFIGEDLSGPILSSRNFYGVVRITRVDTEDATGASYQLINGNTIHGEQFIGVGQRDIPTVYYGPQSGVGLALTSHPRKGFGLKVGALGLGVGTVAAYGQPGDSYRFYEINPLVIRLAEGEGNYFSFLKDSQARIEVVSGDARLSLEHEITEGQAPSFDVLILDVFTNDAIPIHLLDEQAFSLYLRCLQTDGVLAVHITNAYLDLTPVVWTLADHFHLGRALIEDPGDGRTTQPSTWMLLAREASVLSIPPIAERTELMAGYAPTIRLWTDNYSNLFQLLKH